MDSRFFYSTEQLVEAFRAAGLFEGCIAFVHVSLGRLGINRAAPDEMTACKELLRALDSVLGDNGTLLVPTYTYSLGKGELFEPITTPSTIGPFSEFVRTSPGWLRSREPMLAVSGKGPAVKRLFADLPPTCYGYNSLYDRLVEADARIVTIGLDLHWATFRHHCEEVAQVPFRRSKRFSAQIREQDTSITEQAWDYFAAPFLDCCMPDGTRLAKIMRSEGHATVSSVGIGEITVIPAMIYRTRTQAHLSVDPWFTAKGPPCSDEIIAGHMERT